MSAKLKSTTLGVALACALVAGAFMPVTAVHAEVIATPLRGDTRLVQFKFDEDNTYLVLSKPLAVTHVQFAPDEQIKSVAAGDTQNWELSPTKDRKNLFIKPRFEDQETSLTVITDKRAYQFVLKSTGDGKKWYQRVSWLYPSNLVLEEPDAAPAAGTMPAPSANALRPVGQPDFQSALGIELPGIKPEALRFGYTTSGDAPFKPEVIFDDGKFTYLRLPNNLQELPALFAVIAGEDYSLVNYTVRGDYLVAQRLADTFVLKLGKAEVSIAKPTTKKSWFNFSGNGG